MGRAPANTPSGAREPKTSRGRWTYRTLTHARGKLFFILCSFKTYPLQEVMGSIFGMSQSQVNAWVHRRGAVLRSTLGADRHLPERDPASLEAVLAECERLAFLIDGTERPTQRPSDERLQRQAYRGKKRRTRLRTSSS
ncbi:MAG: transposase family protein [Roseiflexus sp.]